MLTKTNHARFDAEHKTVRGLCFTKTVWADCQVTDVATPADFLAKYYKPDRYTGRGEEYAAVLLASYQHDYNTDGFCSMSHFDSITGLSMALVHPRWEEYKDYADYFVATTACAPLTFADWLRMTERDEARPRLEIPD